MLRAKLPFGARAAQPMPLDAYDFKHDKKDYNVYWDVRKGLIPIVGGARETGEGSISRCICAPDELTAVILCCHAQFVEQVEMIHEIFTDLSIYHVSQEVIIDACCAGTSMLIEDVACPVDKLADMTVDLVDMFQRFGYKDASCFGHALEGNLHLVFSQV